MKIGVLGLSPSATSLLATMRGTPSGGAPPINLDFVSTWDTTQAGSASDTVVLPLLSGGTYNGTIDWGDGNTSALSYANRTHVYASSGTYTITISGTDIQGFQFNNGGDRRKITDISNWGNLTLTIDAAFYGCDELTQITATDAPNITTTSLSSFFRNNIKLTYADLSGWDVSSVTNMSDMFRNCNLLTTAGIGNWNVSNVTNFSNMFLLCFVYNEDISSWNTSSALNMSSMFYDAISFNQPLNTWDVSNGIDFRRMFFGATQFNQDISMWNVSNAQRMNRMFFDADAFDQDLSAWDITSVFDFGDFMLSATGLSTVNYDALLVGWEATLQATWAGGTGYPYTININFGGSKYTGGGAADAARASLISNFGWTITDGGAV